MCRISQATQPIVLAAEDTDVSIYNVYSDGNCLVDRCSYFGVFKVNIST